MLARAMITVGIAAVLFLAPCQRSEGQASTPNSVDEVWALEDAYWRYVKAGDVENYRTLWHDDFRGWPCSNEHTATKAIIGDWVREIKDQKIRFSYALMREGAANVGGVIVVYYRTPMIYEYADGRTEGAGKTRKFTHTLDEGERYLANHWWYVRRGRTPVLIKA